MRNFFRLLKKGFVFFVGNNIFCLLPRSIQKVLASLKKKKKKNWKEPWNDNVCEKCKICFSKVP